MKTGLLWFDDNPTRTLQEKIELAIRRYTQKYGHTPNTCYVHPSALSSKQQLRSMHIIPKSNILLHHLWIGEEEQSNQPVTSQSMSTKQLPLLLGFSC